MIGEASPAKAIDMPFQGCALQTQAFGTGSSTSGFDEWQKAGYDKGSHQQAISTIDELVALISSWLPSVP